MEKGVPFQTSCDRYVTASSTSLYDWLATVWNASI